MIQFIFEGTAGQVLCNVHGVTPAIGVKIDGADLPRDLEGGGIKRFAPLSYAKQGAAHRH